MTQPRPSRLSSNKISSLTTPVRSQFTDEPHFRAIQEDYYGTLNAPITPETELNLHQQNVTTDLVLSKSD